MSVERDRRQAFSIHDPESGFAIDFSGMKFEAEDLDAMREKFAAAAAEMKKIEAGEIKNPDEHRKVTHFTDRAVYGQSALFRAVEAFAAKVRSGEITGAAGRPFTAVTVNGIGGSALGPQLMQFAINGPYWNELSAEQRENGLKIYFLDNTDPAGIADLSAVMDPETMLHLVVSKSGGTRETKNNLVALEQLYAARGLDFARHAVAITMKGSELDRQASERRFLQVFEMAESIGGRTSETSVVGHLPAALTGIDFERFLAGACRMDELTRAADCRRNPAMMLAAMWYLAGSGRGDRNMVIVPYSDRLILFSRYMQQLVMESLGKEFDLDGKVVHQGLSVFGNKGGTDAHAFIQQLNDGRDDFFVTFIEVLRNAAELRIDDGNGMGDYLHGFLSGLAAALLGKGRQVIRLTIPEVGAAELGMLIALYERAVAIYAEFIHINAFHQPGVQAYKLAAQSVLAVKAAFGAKLPALELRSGTAAELAAAAGMPDDAGELAGWLDKAAFAGRGVTRTFDAANNEWRYEFS